MFMGFTLHFYIIFGTNLLIGGPARIAVFCLFQCFEEKEYQTESKRDETFGSDLFGTNANLETWSGSQATSEAATRVPGTPLGVGAPPTLVGPSWLPWPTSFAYICPYTPKTSRSNRNTIFTGVTFCIREIPSWSLRRCSAGGSIDHGGLYIISKASPMSCE